MVLFLCSGPGPPSNSILTTAPGARGSRYQPRSPHAAQPMQTPQPHGAIPSTPRSPRRSSLHARRHPLHPGEDLGSPGPTPPVGTALQRRPERSPSWHLPPTSTSGRGRGQRSPASANGPNGRADPLVEKRGAEPGADAHLGAHPRRVCPSPAGASLSPPRG